MRSLSNVFEFRPGMHQPRPMRNGLIVLALFTAVMAYLFTDGKILPLPEDGKLVKAEFSTAANIEIPTTTVRVRGVNVGDVEKVERRAGGDGVLVTMRIKDDGFELRRDARAHIFWRTLLGFQFYIELEPGSAPQPLGDETIPLSRTTAQSEIDQVLAAVDQPSRGGLRAMMREFDKGFARPSEPGRAVDALAPAMRQIGPGLSALRGRRAGDLSDVVRSTSRLTGALARHELELGSLVRSADTTLAVTAARRADLGAMLSQAPSTLADTQATMTRLRATLDELDPIADRLRPGVRRLDEAALALRPALIELAPLLAAARPLLADLRPSLRGLQRAARAGAPLLERLDPTLKRTRDTLLPWLDKTDSGTQIKNYQAIGPVFGTVSNSAQQFDVNGHVQRFQAVAGGGRSLSFLPCHVDFPNGSPFDCSDMQKVVQGLLGGPPAATSGGRR